MTFETSNDGIFAVGKFFRQLSVLQVQLLRLKSEIHLDFRLDKFPNESLYVREIGIISRDFGIIDT